MEGKPFVHSAVSVVVAAVDKPSVASQMGWDEAGLLAAGRPLPGALT